jgi:hypothetical protein
MALLNDEVDVSFDMFYRPDRPRLEAGVGSG